MAQVVKLALACCALVWMSHVPLQADAAQRHVDPRNAQAADSGTGEATHPYRTLSHAMSQLRPGDHLTIAPGVYRDALIFPEADWASADTIIEGQGTVLIKGSDEVLDWKALGEGRYVRDWPQETAQVYVDGKPMQQIGGTLFDGYPDNPSHSLQSLHRSQGGIWPGRISGNETAMPAGSFYYSKDRKALFIRLPSGISEPTRVEVSSRPYLLLGRKIDRITVRNLSFSHGNTSPKVRSGLVTLMGNRIVADGLSVSFADAIGIQLAGDDITLMNSSANECGQLGINARGHRMKLINNETSGNNTRGFNKWWEAGGIKLVGAGGLQDSTIDGHKAFGNQGDGIWFDWKNHNNRVEKSIAAYNTGMGIQYEASTGAVITGNVVVGNGQRGIYLPHSSESEVSHNVVAGNVQQGIVVMDEGVRDPEGKTEFRPRGNRIFGNLVAWNPGALFFPTDLADNRSDSNLYVGTALETRFSLGWPRLGWDRLHEWVSHTGQDRNSQALETPIDPGFAKSISERRRQPDLEWMKAVNAGDVLKARPEWATQRRAEAGSAGSAGSGGSSR